MSSKKICLVGAPGVGKTSLVQRFVNGTFSYRFRPRPGVNVEGRAVDVDGESVQLMLWDFQGHDEFSPTPTKFVEQAAAIVYVVDGTRRDTLARLERLRRETEKVLDRAVPSLILFNKADLVDRWQVSSEMIAKVEAGGTLTLLTSCKQGSGVNTAFKLIAHVVMGKTAVIAA